MTSVQKSEEEMRQIRGKKISMILQDPQTSLNPLYTIGNQLREALGQAHKESTKNMIRRAIDALRSVNVAAPERRMHDYPPPNERRNEAACGWGHLHILRALSDHS